MLGGVNTVFDGVFCINLDRRPDRWKEASKEFERVSIRVERISAVDGNELAHAFGVRLRGIHPGALGLKRTLARLLRLARTRRLGSILVFEDDVTFVEDFEERFETACRDLPTDWAGLWLGGNHRIEPIPVTESIARVQKTYTTHAFALREPLFGPLLRRFENPFSKSPIDYRIARLQKKWPCYAVTPGIALQRASYSDIEDKVMDYSEGMHRIR